MTQKITIRKYVMSVTGAFVLGRKGALPMVHATQSERLQVVLTPEELDMLDDWRFTHRMPSRAAAIRELIKRGLTYTEIAGGNVRVGRRSRDVRIVERKSNGGAHAD